MRSTPLIPAFLHSLFALATATATPVFTEDFESLTDRFPVPTTGLWTTNNDNGTRLARSMFDELNQLGNGYDNRMLDFDQNTATGSPLILASNAGSGERFNGGTSGCVSLVFLEPSTGNGAVKFYLGSNEIMSITTRRYVEASFDNGSLVINGQPAISYDVGIAQFLHIVYNNSGGAVAYPGGSVANQTVDVYLNGRLVLNDAAYANTQGTAALNSLAFVGTNIGSTPLSRLWVDDLVIDTTLAGPDRVFCETFNGYATNTNVPTGGNWNGLTAPSGSSARVQPDTVKAIGEFIHGQYLDFNQGTASSMLKLHNSAGSGGGAAVFDAGTSGSVSFLIHEPATGNGPVTVALGNDDLTTDATRHLIRLAFDSGNVNGTAAYATGTAARIHVVYNHSGSALAYPGGSVANNAYDLYVDGSLVIDDGAYANAIGAVALNGLVIEGGTGYAIPRARLFLDDLCIRRAATAPESFTGWEEAADAAIEANRKRNLTVEALAGGRAVPGASVSVKMLRHAFRFGTAVNVPKLATSFTYKTNYLNAIETLFNSFTPESELKWPEWETPSRQANLRTWMTYFKGKGLDMRGHTAIWPGSGYVPTDVYNAVLAGGLSNANYVRTRISSHIAEIMGDPDIKGYAWVWDVANELVTNQFLQPFLESNGSAAPVEKTWFDFARIADPDCLLALNENNVVSSATKIVSYFGQIDALFAAGADIDVLAVQAHFRGTNFDALPNAYLFRHRMQALGSYGKFMEITEFDAFNPDPAHPVQFSDADYAEILRQLLKTAYANPQMLGFTMWGFWDGSHWENNAPLYYSDFTPKPALAVWQQLLFTDWWTPDASGPVDSNGEYTLRGFEGLYEITVDFGNGDSQTREVWLTGADHTETFSTAAPVDTYAYWIADPAFGLAPADRDPNGDPDFDGRKNIQEFFFATPPHLADGSFTHAVERDGATWKVRFRRRPEVSDVSWSLDYSDDLQNWTTLDPAGLTNTSPDPDYLMLVGTLPVPGDRAFVRFVITYP